MSYYGGGWISIIWGIFCFVGSYNIGNSYLMTKINNREESKFKTQNAFGKINLKINNFNSIRLLVSCHLCDVAKMTVIPASAGIQKPEVARNTGFPPSWE